MGFMAGKFIPIREWLANGVKMGASVGAVSLAERFRGSPMARVLLLRLAQFRQRGGTGENYTTVDLI
jgi:hypothetical protein